MDAILPAKFIIHLMRLSVRLLYSTRIKSMLLHEQYLIYFNLQQKFEI